MIVAVWGTINSERVDFQKCEDRPGWWEGFGPRKPIYQQVEIWAKNDLGAVGHLQTQLVIREWSPTKVQLLLAPFTVRLLGLQTSCMLKEG